jgi:prophage endopeptidase
MSPRAFVITLVLAALLGASAWLGHQYATAQATATAKTTAQQAEKSLRQATERARSAEHSLTQLKAERDAKREQDQKDAQAQRDRFLADVRSGALRVSIPVRANQCTAGRPSPDPTPQPQQARAELAPEAAAVLDAIAGDGDAAIIDLNTCIDRYNDARVTLSRLQANRAGAALP